MQYRILGTFVSESLCYIERPVISVNMWIRLRNRFQGWRIIIQVALQISDCWNLSWLTGEVYLLRLTIFAYKDATWPKSLGSYRALSSAVNLMQSWVRTKLDLIFNLKERKKRSWGSGWYSDLSWDWQKRIPTARPGSCLFPGQGSLLSPECPTPGAAKSSCSAGVSCSDGFLCSRIVGRNSESGYSSCSGSPRLLLSSLLPPNSSGLVTCRGAGLSRTWGQQGLASFK